MDRALKVLIAAGVVVFSLGLTIVAGEPPEDYLSVEQAQAMPDGEVQIVAMVVPGTIEQTDDGRTHFEARSEGNATINVTYDRGLTEAFGADKWVVVTGTVVEEDGEAVIQAEDVQVGCPSKWDASKAET